MGHPEQTHDFGWLTPHGVKICKRCGCTYDSAMAGFRTACLPKGLTQEKVDEVIRAMDDARVPAGRRAMICTWEQAQKLGMSRKRWLTGVPCGGGRRIFEGDVNGV